LIAQGVILETAIFDWIFGGRVDGMTPGSIRMAMVNGISFL
jgi:hypothetical protein